MSVPILLDASGTPCLLTAATHAEVITKSLDRGIDPTALRTILANIGYTIIDIQGDDGAAAEWIRDATRAHGLSLGDRLCLAVAQRLQVQVHTADRPWLLVADALQLDIRCIRPDQH